LRASNSVKAPSIVAKQRLIARSSIMHVKWK